MEIWQFESDLTHNPSKHLTGVSGGQVAMLQEVIFGFTQIPEAHFNGNSFGHPLEL
jgi:hypothetical protein